MPLCMRWGTWPKLGMLVATNTIVCCMKLVGRKEDCANAYELLLGKQAIVCKVELS